jgi:hypothetical protein
MANSLINPIHMNGYLLLGSIGRAQLRDVFVISLTSYLQSFRRWIGPNQYHGKLQNYTRKDILAPIW